MPAAGVPARVAVPSPLSTKVTPVGSAPVSLSAAVGVPVVVTVNVPALPVANDLAAGAGDRRGLGGGDGQREGLGGVGGHAVGGGDRQRGRCRRCSPPGVPASVAVPIAIVTKLRRRPRPVVAQRRGRGPVVVTVNVPRLTDGRW